MSLSLDYFMYSCLSMTLSFLFCCCNGQSALLCFFENVWYFFLALKIIPIFLNRVLINLPSAYFEQYKTQCYFLKFNDTKVLSTRNIFSWEFGISTNCVIQPRADFMRDTDVGARYSRATCRAKIS